MLYFYFNRWNVIAMIFLESRWMTINPQRDLRVPGARREAQAVRTKKESGDLQLLKGLVPCRCSYFYENNNFMVQYCQALLDEIVQSALNAQKSNVETQVPFNPQVIGL